MRNEFRQRIPEDGNPSVQRLSAAIEKARIVVEHDEAAAGFVLDGLMKGMVHEWYDQQLIPVPEDENLLKDLEGRHQNASWRLRQALRAPDGDARLIHCRDLFNLLFAQNS